MEKSKNLLVISFKTAAELEKAGQPVIGSVSDWMDQVKYVANRFSSDVVFSCMSDEFSTMVLETPKEQRSLKLALDQNPNIDVRRMEASYLNTYADSCNKYIRR